MGAHRHPPGQTPGAHAPPMARPFLGWVEEVPHGLPHPRTCRAAVRADSGILWGAELRLSLGLCSEPGRPRSTPGALLVPCPLEGL